MASEASVSSALDGDSDQTSDLPSGSISTDSEPVVPSLLDRLRKVWVTRKRALRKNLSSAESYCKKRPSCSTTPKSITLHSRVRDFPGENLKVSAGKLFCTACREEVSLKRSIVTNHIASVKHKQSKVKLAKKESREKDIAEALVAYASLVPRYAEQISWA
jgi:hypothetical protein